MKKIILSLLAISLLISCKPSNPNATPTEKYEVELLFEKDGIKMYRFFDQGHYRYFTSRGEIIGIQTSGKSSYSENIN